MSTTQSACVLHGPKDLRLESRTVWPPNAGEVQVKILSVGLCGSDLHYYTHARNGDFALRAPFVLGHEAVGVITAIGPPPEQSASHVHTRTNGSLSIGQRVVLEPGIYCGTCSFCSRGRYNLCAPFPLRSCNMLTCWGADAKTCHFAPARKHFLISMACFSKA